MPFWTPESVRAACAGSWLVRPPQIELPKDRPADLPLPPLHAPISGLSTDSRSIKPGQVFLALRGENFDGHAFLESAARAGAPILIIDDPSALPQNGFDPPVGVMKVADTAAALLRIAAAYRKTLERTRVVAVCGSNGKTTTTNLIAHILSTCGLRGTSSRKSFNNAVGVPLTILSAQPTDQYLICEVGTNAPGEIAQLAEVVNPDIAVVTSIGREHLEKLGDLAGVAREEGSVFKYLTPKGCAVVNADIPELREHLDKAPQVITFGRNSEANFRLTGVSYSPSPRQGVEGTAKGAADHRAAATLPTTDIPSIQLHFTFNNRFTASIPLLGEHNALNALAALAVARRFGVDESKALAALAAAHAPDMRFQVSVIAPLPGSGSGPPVVLVNDAYNANPDSMSAAIRTLFEIAPHLMPAPPVSARTVCILADMLELGEAAPAGHESIAHALLSAASSPPTTLVILAGPLMAHAREALRSAGWPADVLVHEPDTDDRAIARIAKRIEPGDLVLIKGSRRMRLERIAQALQPAAQAPVAAARVKSTPCASTGA